MAKKFLKRLKVDIYIPASYKNMTSSRLQCEVAYWP